MNVYGEKNPPDAVSPFTYYPCPGTRLLSAPATPSGARGLYSANSGDLYYITGSTVCYVDPSWNINPIGTIGTTTGIVSMADNGTSLVLVDGSINGYEIDLTTRAFSQINSTDNAPPSNSGSVYAFYGADRVDVLDGYLLLNQPGTRNFYSTYLNQVVFDALYFAAKNGYSDNLVAVIVTRREIWLIGERTAEIWFNAGSANFPFQIMPGPFVQHGCSAKYSVAQVDGAVFWLSQDQAGDNILARGEGYTAKAITTQALVAEWSKYPTTSDAQGFCFQQNGHSFYQINFPSADKSWRWDETTQQWHEPVWIDTNGIEHRHRASCAAYAYGTNVCGDWENGNLYALDPATYTDNGATMVWRRGFPHMMKDGYRVRYASFIADMQCGTAPGTYSPPIFPIVAEEVPPIVGGNVLAVPSGDALLVKVGIGPDTSPKVGLRWSDNRGATYSNPIQQTLGAQGQYLAQPKWNRLGMARDRVFELYGNIVPGMALNGAFVEQEPSGS